MMRSDALATATTEPPRIISNKNSEVQPISLCFTGREMTATFVQADLRATTEKVLSSNQGIFSWFITVDHREPDPFSS